MGWLGSATSATACLALRGPGSSCLHPLTGRTTCWQRLNAGMQAQLVCKAPHDLQAAATAGGACLHRPWLGVCCTQSCSSSDGEARAGGQHRTGPRKHQEQQAAPSMRLSCVSLPLTGIVCARGGLAGLCQGPPAQSPRVAVAACDQVCWPLPSCEPEAAGAAPHPWAWCVPGTAA